MNSRNPFISENIASNYESWYQTKGNRVDQQEKNLLMWLLGHFPAARSMLEIGSGTGHFTRWFENEQDMQVYGLDKSRAMLNKAKEFGSCRLVQGDAIKLPFLSKSVDIVVLITSLEFLEDPISTIREAYRTARQGLILGIINNNSLLGIKYKLIGGPIWGNAHLYSINKIKKFIKQTANRQAEIMWRTTLWPLISGHLPLPWGGFIGMAVRWDAERRE